MTAGEWATLLTALAAVISAWAEYRSARARLDIESVRAECQALAERVARLEGRTA